MRTHLMIAAVALALGAGSASAQNGTPAARFKNFDRGDLAGRLAESCIMRGGRAEQPTPSRVKCYAELGGREKLAAGFLIGNPRQAGPWGVRTYDLVQAGPNVIVQLRYSYEAVMANDRVREEIDDSKRTRDLMAQELKQLGGEPL